MCSISGIDSFKIKVTSIKKTERPKAIREFFNHEVVNIRSLIQLPDGRIVLAIANENESKGGYIDVFKADGSHSCSEPHSACPFGIS